MNDFCILLCTCKKYEFLLDPFLFLLRKYWPSFNGNIYINSEDFGPKKELKGCRIIDNTNHISWSDRLINSLKCIKEDYVLLVLDDFLFKGPVKDKEFYNSFEYQKLNKIKCLQFYPQNKLNKKSDLDDFLFRRRFAPYRISAQICMYEKSYLLKIARKNENPWEFELCGSFRSSLIYGGKIMCAQRNNNYIFDTDIGFLIVRGVYTDWIRKRFEKEENIFLPDLVQTNINGKKRSSKLLRKIKLLIKCLISIFYR